jgi:hypothetical protein
LKDANQPENTILARYWLPQKSRRKAAEKPQKSRKKDADNWSRLRWLALSGHETSNQQAAQ